MRVYIGQTRARALTERLIGFGFGEMTVRNEVPPRRTPWVLDNGAFKDWTSGAKFDEAKFAAALERAKHVEPPPDFVVAPDIVAGGAESLAFSRSWLPRCLELGVPVYLVMQDGMTEQSVLEGLDGFSGIFVGGSLPWKLRTGERWCEFAHLHGMPCHIGRMGTEARVRAAKRWGADSIDSCLPLWSEDNLQRFLAGFRCSQQTLWGDEVLS